MRRIQEKREDHDNSRMELKGFNKTGRCVLAEWSRKINCILKHIRTEKYYRYKYFYKSSYGLCRENDWS